MKSTYEFMFEPSDLGIRFVLWRDYYSDGERELLDIIEKPAPIRANKVSRDIFSNIADRFYLETACIKEATTKTVIFESYDDEDILQRACLLDYFAECIKTVLKEKRNV